MKKILAALILSALAPLAQADVYRVDLLVFIDRNASGEQGRPFEMQEPGKSIALQNADALKAAGITVLPDEQFGLANEWKRLKGSKNYQPVIRLSWTQDNPPADRSKALRLSWGETMVVDGGAGMTGLARPVEGSVALLLGNYLNLDVNLAYAERTGNGAQIWRLREKRRMKRDEIHHLDSPRLGVLARVSKLGAAK